MVLPLRHSWQLLRHWVSLALLDPSLDRPFPRLWRFASIRTHALNGRFRGQADKHKRRPLTTSAAFDPNRTMVLAISAFLLRSLNATMPVPKGTMAWKGQDP